SRFFRMYSLLVRPACRIVRSRNMQGEESLQHQARLPKQVCFPSARGVSLTYSCFSFMYSSLVTPAFSRVGIRGQFLTGMQQNARERRSPPLQSCFGELYQPCSSAYRDMAASRPPSVRSSAFRASETMSAPWESISFIRSKVCMELFA